jgi:hypothetical protein
VLKTLDLTRGAGRDVTFGRQVDGTSVSFFQNRGVRPGINRLTFGVEQYGDVELRRARILGDSGLIVSRRSPARLRLEPRLPRKTLEVGGKAKLGYQVSNTGDRPLMDVVVAMQSHHEALRVRGPSQVRIGRLGQSRTGHFLIEAHRPGRRRLTLAASSSNANNPVVELEVNVPRADQKTSSVGMGLILAGALLGVVGVGVLGYSAARRSARGRPS